jgi:hypothetical protein
MKKALCITATTKALPGRQQITRDELEQLADQSNRTYIPFTVEHREFSPPVGRTGSSRVREGDNGEYVLEVEVEMWEEGDTYEKIRGDGRRMARTPFPPEGFTVAVDGPLTDDAGQALLSELNELGCTSITELDRRALDPVASMLISLAASPVISHIYQAAMAALGRYQASRGQTETQLYSFRFPFVYEAHEVEVVVTGLSGEVDQILRALIGCDQKLNSLLSNAITRFPEATRITLTCEQGQVKIHHIVMADCVPLSADGQVIVTSENITSGLGVSISVGREYQRRPDG